MFLILFSFLISNNLSVSLSLSSYLSLESTSYPPPGLPSDYFLSHTSSCISKSMSQHTLTHPRRSPHYLGDQLSSGVGTSSSTETRSVSPLLYMIHRLHMTSVCCLVGGLVSERSHGSGLVETVGLPLGSPSSSAPSCLSLTQPQGSWTSVIFLQQVVSFCNLDHAVKFMEIFLSTPLGWVLGLGVCVIVACFFLCLYILPIGTSGPFAMHLWMFHKTLYGQICRRMHFYFHPSFGLCLRILLPNTNWQKRNICNFLICGSDDR